jgi:formate hydrogenlyase subunit 4
MTPKPRSNRSGPESLMNRIKAFVLTSLLLLALWLLLSAPFSTTELIVGAVAVLIIAILPTGFSTLLADLRVTRAPSSACSCTSSFS